MKKMEKKFCPKHNIEYHIECVECYGERRERGV